MEAEQRPKPVSNEAEAKQIAAARAGDQLAYESLEQQYRPLLSAQVSYTMTALPASLQEDCLQVAREAFHQAICHYDASNGASFGYFAKVCVQNRLCSYFRKQSARVHREQNMEAEELARHLPESSEVSIDRIFEREDWAQWCEGLSTFEQEVWAYSFAGNRPRQIARALERSPKSVYNALVRIRGKKKKS